MKKNYLPFLLLLAVLPVLVFRDYTPSNELRYLSIADEALRNGNIFTFTNHGIAYADKPPLYLWIVMLGRWLLGNHYMWFLSLFSFIPALVIMNVMDKWVSRQLAERDRLTGKLMLMSTGLFLGLAVVLRMDMLMCMFIVLSLYTFYRMLKGEGHKGWNTFLFPFYIFMAVFSKGPVGILIPLLSTFAFLLLTKRMKTIGRYWGWRTWGVLLVGCTVWFGGVFWEGGSAYLNNLLFHQTVDRAVDSFHHKEPFYYYLVSVWYSLAPWSLLLIGVIGAGVYRKLIHSDLERFFVTILLTTFVMLSFISSKIAVYLAPAFPFFVYLAVLWLSRFRWNQWLALSVAIPAVVFVCSAPVLFILVKRPEMAFLAQKPFYVASVLLGMSGIAALWLLYRKKDLNRTINTLAIGLFCSIFLGGWALPAANQELGFADLCRKAVEISGRSGTNGYCTFGISRPENMDVFLHEDVRKVEMQDILDGTCSGTLLLIRQQTLDAEKSLSDFVIGKENTFVGPYVIIPL